jgi:hypothetical protein
MKMVTGEGGGKWEVGGAAREMGCCDCRAGKPNVLQRAEQRNRQHSRVRPSCVTACAVEGKGRPSSRASIACCRRLQPSIRGYRTIPQHWLTEPVI